MTARTLYIATGLIGLLGIIALGLWKGVVQTPGVIPAPTPAPLLAASPDATDEVFPTDNVPKDRIRPPAAAGMLYPADANELTAVVDGYLSKAQSSVIGTVRAILVPDGRYQDSGQTAAFAYRLLVGKSYPSIILLSSPRYSLIEGGAVPDVEAFSTPLGLVRVSPRVAAMAQTPPLSFRPTGMSAVPPWALGRTDLGPQQKANAFTYETSQEVQLPFLQRTLKGFMILPVLLGQVESDEAAAALLKHIDDRTLIVVSSDLSHGYSGLVAAKIDQGCIKAICDLDVQAVQRQELSAPRAVETLVQIARRKGWQAKLLDTCNSGETGGESMANVDGYAAIAFTELESDERGKARDLPPLPLERQAEYSPEDRQCLLSLAHKALAEAIRDRRISPIDANGLPKKLTEIRGCSVTLIADGKVRGAVGNLHPRSPLWAAAMGGAVSSALSDSRFKPVTAEELPGIVLKISVVTPPKRLEFNSELGLLSQLCPYEDGIVFQLGDKILNFMPEEWYQYPNKMAILDALCVKAGQPADTWKSLKIAVWTFQMESFHDPIPMAPTSAPAK